MTGKHFAQTLRRTASGLLLAALAVLLALPDALPALCADESVTELERKLAEQEKTLGPEHPDVAATLDTLAQYYTDGFWFGILGEEVYVKIEPCYRRALAIREKALGPDHLEVAASLDRLAKHLGERPEETEPLDLRLRALAIREKALGPDHPDVVDTLERLAGGYYFQKQYEKAEPLYLRILTIWEKEMVPEHADVIRALENLAGVYEKQEQYEKAEALYQRALAIREKELGPDDPAAGILDQLGQLYKKSDALWTKAESLYQRNLAAKEKQLGAEHPEVIRSLNNLARLHKTLGHYDRAEALYQRALTIREKTLGADHPNVAKNLDNLAKLYEEQKQYDKAEAIYQRTLTIREKALDPDHPDVAGSLLDLANLYFIQAQYDKAKPIYLRLCAIRENESGCLEGVALIYTDEAKANWLGGRKQVELLFRSALEFLESALGPDHPRVAKVLNNLAVFYKSRALYAKAESLHKRALEIREKQLGPDHPDVADSLNNLAALYAGLSQFALAESLYQRALEIHPHALFLNNLAVLYLEQGRVDKAEPLLQRALTIYEKERDLSGAGHVLGNLAGLYDDNTAESLYKQTLAIREEFWGTDHPDVVSSLNNLARLYVRQSQYDKAEPLLLRALPIAEGSGEPELLWNVQDNLRILYAKSNPNLAVFYGKQTVNTLQGVRAMNTDLDRETQQSFLKSKEEYYTDLADLLFAQGRLAEGQQVMAMLKEAEYHEFIERSADSDPRSTRADLTPEEAKQNARYREMGDNLAALGKEYRTLTARDKAGLDEAEKRRKTELREALNAAKKQYAAMLKEVERDFAALGGEQKTAFDKKNIENFGRMSGTLKELGHGAVLLSYLVAEERLWILLTTGDRVSLAREVPVKAADLNKKIAAFREAVTDRRTNAGELGKELHELLIAPVADALDQAEAKTLMLSLDGALRYLPFAALRDGKQYLVERYALAVYTEVAKDKLRAKPKPDWRFAGFGVTRAVGGHSPLAAVREELEGIRENALDGPEPLYDDAFNAESFRDALDQSPPVAHVASHFVFSPGNEQNSYLLLGDGGKLTLADIREEDYPFDVDLVALSACETAVGGGRDENGQEVEGFGVLVQQQGAKGVLATLWPVADESTGQLMQLFYGYRQQAGLTKAEALRKAQMAFIEGRVDKALKEVDRGRRTDASAAAGGQPPPARSADPAHPYFWAPFILMGNWL